MQMMKRIVALLALLVLMSGGLPALGEEPPQLRGYDKRLRYQYVSFGMYPTQKDGTREPVLWRVLGVQDGIAFLMTEHIIDCLVYNTWADTDRYTPFLYADTMIRQTCNEQCAYELFTEAERACLLEMSDGRGLLSVPSVDELLNTAYGFLGGKYTVDARRQAVGTPYAHEKGLKKHPVKGYGNRSWYWTTEWRRAGARWIVGSNGHISVQTITNAGGLRPVCYARVNMLTIVSGSGTMEAPLRLMARTRSVPPGADETNNE